MRRTGFEPQHEDFRDSVWRFVVVGAVARIAEWEAAGMVDRRFWAKAAALGLVGFEAPEHLGGAGLSDFRFNAISPRAYREEFAGLPDASSAGGQGGHVAAQQ
jgi:acyl-CoA dehydrogenase